MENKPKADIPQLWNSSKHNTKYCLHYFDLESLYSPLRTLRCLNKIQMVGSIRYHLKAKHKYCQRPQTSYFPSVFYVSPLVNIITYVRPIAICPQMSFILIRLERMSFQIKLGPAPAWCGSLPRVLVLRQGGRWVLSACGQPEGEKPGSQL